MVLKNHKGSVYFMQTFRLAGEWLITEPSDITVTDFVAWRRSPKGRKFSPFLLLKVGEHDVAIDGYEAVWAFFDAIQPGMYRSSVNTAMSGLMPEVTSFIREAQTLIDESAVQDLLIQYTRVDGLQIPNDYHTVDVCYSAICIRDCSTQHAANSDLPGYNRSLSLPFRGKEGLDYLDVAVFGENPQFVLATDSRVCAIAYNPHGRDLRPHRWSAPSDMRAAITFLSHTMSERRYLSPGDNRDAPMFTLERDALEHDWAFLSSDEQE